MMPGPAWVPTTGPMSATMSGNCVGMSFTSEVEGGDVGVARRTLNEGEAAQGRVIPSDVGYRDQSLGAGALASRLGDETGLHVDHRFDREHLTQERLRAADSSALDQVFERVEGGDDSDLADGFVALCDERVEVCAFCRRLGDVDHNQTLAHRDVERVDDAHRKLRAQRLGTERGALMGGGQQ